MMNGKLQRFLLGTFLRLCSHTVQPMSVLPKALQLRLWSSSRLGSCVFEMDDPLACAEGNPGNIF